jgi:hypothetical protein
MLTQLVIVMGFGPTGDWVIMAIAIIGDPTPAGWPDGSGSR